MDTARQRRKPRYLWGIAAGIAAIAVFAVLLVMSLAHSRRMPPPTYAELQQYVRGAVLSTQYADADFRAVVGLLGTLTPQQVGIMRQRTGLPYMSLSPSQRDMLAGLVLGRQEFFAGVDLADSCIRVSQSPNVMQFRWHVERGGREDVWAMGLHY